MSDWKKRILEWGGSRLWIPDGESGSFGKAQEKKVPAMTVIQTRKTSTNTNTNTKTTKR